MHLSRHKHMLIKVSGESQHAIKYYTWTLDEVFDETRDILSPRRVLQKN